MATPCNFVQSIIPLARSSVLPVPARYTCRNEGSTPKIYTEITVFRAKREISVFSLETAGMVLDQFVVCRNARYTHIVPSIRHTFHWFVETTR